MAESVQPHVGAARDATHLVTTNPTTDDASTTTSDGAYGARASGGDASQPFRCGSALERLERV
jgi:hypothetical protein